MQDGEQIIIKVPFTEFLIIDGYTALSCKSQGPYDFEAAITYCDLQIFDDYFTIQYSASCPDFACYPWS